MTEDDRAAVERALGDRYQIIRDLHRLAAIKVLGSDRAWSDAERERLLREARTIAI